MQVVTFRPFTTWPRSSSGPERKRHAFSAGYQKTLKDLERELDALNAHSIVIQINLDPDQIRLDGMPRADAYPRHPGVILSFQSKFGPLQYLCDACTTWQHNLRAIVLTLERLRLADIYGVSKRGEQYKGWAQLPSAPTNVFASKMEAGVFILQKTGVNFSNAPVEGLRITKELLAKAIKACHPDTGGSHDDFLKLKAAREMLGV